MMEDKVASMNNTKWTSEQWEAITEKDCNLLVAAAAGAGKTAVLVERIIRKMTDEAHPVDIDRMLIVTFTNAAATEMRERIAEAISQVLEKNPQSRVIQRQLALLNKASITTVHAFCMEVIRNNFQSLSIDPNFRIADETESTLMKLEALNEVFEEQYEKETNVPFFELLECYGGNRDDQTLMDIVLSLYDFIQSSPWPEAWLGDMTENLNLSEGTDFGTTSWGKVLLHRVMLELKGLHEMMERAVGLVKTGLGLEKYLPVYREDLLSVESLMNLVDSHPVQVWDKLYHSIQELEFSTLPRAAKEVDKEKQEQAKKIRDDVKARIKKLRERVLTADSKEIIKDLKILYPAMKCLADLVRGMSSKYAEKKNRRSVTDFNDLEHFCLEILSQKGEDGNLRPSPVAVSYRERYCEILVDEYQDSNMVQETMINMISRTDSDKPNVFMVGDVKQSIYRFRQARPELFLQKYNTYSPDKGPFRKILLFKNFRSRKNVVDAVNFLFKQIMSVNVGELDYTDSEALHPGAVFADADREDYITGGEAELHLIETGTASAGSMEGTGESEDAAQEDEGEDEEILDNIQCEARLVAQRILRLMKPDEEGRIFTVWDKGLKAYRKVEFRDIVILLRTTRNWSAVFVDEMALMGIPAFADTGSGFFKTIEVQVVLSLLQIIDNPLQDIPLLSVLRSPMVVFTTGELTDMRLSERKVPLYEALIKLAESGSGEASKKAGDFLEKLHKWRKLSLYCTTDELIWRLYNETGYYGMVGAMPAGEQRQANLRILFNRARQFEETSYKGLFNFINFIDKLKSNQGDMGSAKILSENDNVVRLMSIHKSKGLEFPVVFLSGCGKKFNLQDMNKSILLHQDLGFGPEVVDHRLRISWPSAAKQAIREKIKAETLSEEMRILYVALTRAREKLIITGAVRDAGKILVQWMEGASAKENRLPDYEMFKAHHYLDWMGPALLRHQACDGLRALAPVGKAFDGSLMEDPSKWCVKLWNKNDVLTKKIAEVSGEDTFYAWLDSLGDAPSVYEDDKGAYTQLTMDEAFRVESELNQKDDKTENLSGIKAEINRRLSWEYAFLHTSKIPAKISVTELKRRYNAQASEEVAELSTLKEMTGFTKPLIKKPKFMEEKKGLSAAEKGTILHFIMQHLDLKPLRGSSEEGLSLEIERQMDRMVAKDLLTRQQAESVNEGKVGQYFKSELGKRMLESQSINREIPFNMEIPCSELTRENVQNCGEDSVLLQGVIDCYFEEPDGIVLIDYKTDYVQEGQEEIVKDRYRLQIGFYTRALEMLTGKKVKERFIYLFWNGQAVALP